MYNQRVYFGVEYSSSPMTTITNDILERLKAKTDPTPPLDRKCIFWYYSHFGLTLDQDNLTNIYALKLLGTILKEDNGKTIQKFISTIFTLAAESDSLGTIE